MSVLCFLVIQDRLSCPQCKRVKKRGQELLFMTKRTKGIIWAQKNIFLQATARHILKGRSDSKINQIICKTLHERYPIKFATRALLVETKCAQKDLVHLLLKGLFTWKGIHDVEKCETGTHINSLGTNLSLFLNSFYLSLL